MRLGRTIYFLSLSQTFPSADCVVRDSKGGLVRCCPLEDKDTCDLCCSFFLCCWLPPVKLSSGLLRSSALAESQWEPSVQLTFDCVPLRRFACSSLLSKCKRRISCCHPLQVCMLRGSSWRAVQEESSDVAHLSKNISNGIY